MNLDELLTFSLILIASAASGALLFFFIYRLRFNSLTSAAEEMLKQAELKAAIFKKEAECELHEKEKALSEKAQASFQNEKQNLNKREERIKEREDTLERRMSLVERKLSDIEKREHILQARREQVDQERKKIQQKEEALLKSFEELSGMSPEEAKIKLFDEAKLEIQKERARMTQRMLHEIEEEKENAAARIISTAINRLSVPTVSETATLAVPLPGDELKGRIIGRDGRNIRTLERLTGVNFLVDESPGSVLISGFDPFRKAVAKVALKELIADGRIHPTRIEEAVRGAEVTVKKEMKKAAEEAALRCSALHLHPELMELLGRLSLRTSYGQNVLDHSVEVSHILGMMAEDLKLDGMIARRMGLLHDIGKAVSQDVKGTHALIGRDLALKYGESDIVANGIGCHHDEIPPLSVLASLVGPADKISASRPAARVEAVEEVFQRLKKLETLAYQFPGIEQAYAMQAGKEVLVTVLPEMIDDLGLENLAKDLSGAISDELSFPGQIKVTVIREKRAVVYAV